MIPTPNESELEAIIKRIDDLSDEKDHLVRAAQYEAAARCRDEIELLKHKLKGFGNAVLLKNIELFRRSAPVTEAFETRGGEIDESLLEKLNSLSPPIRWSVRNINTAPVKTLRRRLDVNSRFSPYYLAKFPVVSAANLREARVMDQWLTALARETARSEVHTIWACTDITWLGTNGILEKWWELFQHQSFEFVACLEDDKSPWARRILEITTAV